MKGNRLFLSAIVAGTLALAASPGAALAASANSNSFEVRATVQPKCTISAVNFDFGVYDPLATSDHDVANASGLTVQCTRNATATIGMGFGTAGSPQRKMSNGTQDLNYGFYSDAGRSNAWGTTVGTDTLAYTQPANSSPQSVAIYGRIPAGQDVEATAAPYTDNVVATINF